MLDKVSKFAKMGKVSGCVTEADTGSLSKGRRRRRIKTVIARKPGPSCTR